MVKFKKNKNYSIYYYFNNIFQFNINSFCKTVSIFSNCIFFFVNKFEFIKKIKQFGHILIFGFMYYFSELIEIFSFYIFCLITISHSYVTWFLSFLIYGVLLLQFACNGEILLISPLPVSQFEFYPPLLIQNSNLTLFDEIIIKEEQNLGHAAFFILIGATIMFLNARYYPFCY